MRLFHVNKGVLAITDTGLARVWDVTSGIMECESNLATDGFEMYVYLCMFTVPVHNLV